MPNKEVWQLVAESMARAGGFIPWWVMKEPWLAKTAISVLYTPVTGQPSSLTEFRDMSEAAVACHLFESLASN